MSEQIADSDMPDPWMFKYNGKYLLTFTTGNNIVLWSSPYLEDFHEKNSTTVQRVLWQPSGNVQMSGIWAPEIHIVNNTWYIYFTAEVPPRGNPTHRMHVLRGPPSSEDPMAPSSTFNLVGQIANLPDHWQIDGTVFTLNNQLYLVYSGWPLNEPDGLTQQLFIAKMIDPVTAEPSTKSVMVSTPSMQWEKFKDSGPNGAVHAINEGPAWLELDSFKGIVYSAGASWTNDYQLGMLQYLGGDPLNISSWKKYPQQLLSNNPDGRGPYGPGHCSFVLSPDNKQLWVIFHATPNSGDGWNHRKARCQLVVDKAGMPFTNLYPYSPTTVTPSGSTNPEITRFTRLDSSLQQVFENVEHRLKI